MISTANDLRALDDATRALAAASTLPEVKALRDKAEAARAYAKAAHMGLDLQNRAAEFKLRAERKAGALLKRLSLRGGDRRSERAARRLSLEDLGISRSQSRRWQLVAALSETDFNAFVAQKKQLAEEITLADAIRLARQRAKAQTNGNSNSANHPQVASGTQSHISEPLEVVSELKDHHALLSQLLGGVTAKDATNLKPAEKRMIGRLLNESSQLLQRLEKALVRSANATFTSHR